MTEYEKLGFHEGDGVCKTLVDEIPDKLKELYDKQERDRLEHAMAFGIIDGEVKTSSIKKGNSGAVSRQTQMQAIGDMLEETGDEYKSIGVIHTHPKGDDQMNMAMSPGDLNNHIQFMDGMNGYDTTLVLTKDEGEYVLFGIESKDQRFNLASYQDMIAQHKRNMDLMRKHGGNIIQEVHEMTETVMEISESCSIRFTV